MKNQIASFIAVFAMFLGLAVADVQGQTPSRVEVNIPFEFSAGKTTMKPGVYTVKRMSGNLVALQHTGNKSSVILNAPVNLSSTNAEAPERLVFNKSGDQYSLAQIWLTVDSGRELLKKRKGEKFERIELALGAGKHVD